MSYVDKHLLNNETVLYRTSRHWVIFLLPVLLAFVAIGFLVQQSLLNLVGYILLFLAIALWLHSLITYLSSEYAITNRRILVKTGFLRRDSYETLLHRVAGIQVSQSAWGRLLDYGNIMIYGIGGEIERFIGIATPLEFRKKILEQIETNEESRGRDVTLVKKPVENYLNPS